MSPVRCRAVACCALALLAAAGAASASEGLPSVAYRRMVGNPGEYAGRRLAVPACAATAAHHGAYLYDCRDADVQLVTLSGSRDAEQALFGERRVFEQRRASAVMVGVLEWRPDAPMACCLDPRYVFHLERVEGVSALPLPATD